MVPGCPAVRPAVVRTVACSTESLSWPRQQGRPIHHPASETPARIMAFHRAPSTPPACAARFHCLLLICMIAGPPPSAMGQAVGGPATNRIVSSQHPSQPRDSLPRRWLAPLDRRVSEPREWSFSATAWPTNLAPTDSGPGVWKYVGWGAVIGGAAVGGYAAYRARNCDDCMFVGLYIGGATGIGAVLGGLIGSFIYAGRYWSDDG